jgi:hypothetical protein
MWISTEMVSDHAPGNFPNCVDWTYRNKVRSSRMKTQLTSVIIHRLKIKYRSKESLIGKSTPIAIAFIFRSKDLSFGSHNAAKLRKPEPHAGI